MAGKIGMVRHKKSPEDTPPGFESWFARNYFFLAGVAQQAWAVVFLAAGALQQEEQFSFFLAKTQWPFEQLLSSRLVETKARVRSDFIVCVVWMASG